MSGYPDGTFRPDTKVNRAELMKLFVSISGRQLSPQEYHDCFPDVHTEWFAPAVCFAAQQGWVQGYADGMFRPGDPVNLVEALKMLVKARGYDAVQLGDTGLYDPEAWFAPYLDAAIARNILPPGALTSSSGVRLDAPVPRKDIAAYLYQALVSQDAVSSILSGDDCADREIASVRLQTDAVGMQTLLGIMPADDEGIADSTCVLSTDANPYRQVSPFIEGALALLVPETFDDGEKAPVVDGHVFLRQASRSGDTGSELWVFNVAERQLQQVAHVETAQDSGWILPGYQAFVFLSADGSRIELLELRTRQIHTVAYAASGETFASAPSYGAALFAGDMHLSSDGQLSVAVHRLQEGVSLFPVIRTETYDLSPWLP